VKEFIYAKMPKVYFGEGMLKKALPDELKKVGNTVMLAYGGGSVKRTGLYDKVVEVLKENGKNVVEFSGIMSNPTYSKVQEGAKLAKENNVDFILAVGGGSVIDCCKIVAAQAKVDEDIWKMEFEDRKLPTEFIKLASVVTASGTGAEMNNGAVITNEDKKLKAGMLGALSDFVILDPSYTLTVPMKQVISGAFDTLSHCMETYFGKPAETNVSDEITEGIMRNVIKNIREVIKNPEDVNVRSELMWDSSIAECGLLKLGKVTDFQAHQIEHQLGAYTDCNHGQGLAVIHPKLYRHIYKENISKFARFAVEVWKVDSTNRSQEEIAEKGIEELDKFIKEIGLPITLTELGITDKEMLRKVADSSNITAGCAKQLSHDEIYEILIECM
jgi:alcohol dehydrogenase YqhD (iron-dependent ADH family)